MSLTRRILESARTGLSQLTSLVIVDDEPLSHVEAAVLEAELTARRKARTQPPGQQRVARLAGASTEARAERGRMAAERLRRVHGERDRRAAQQQRSTEEAFRRIKEQAAHDDRAGRPPPRADAPRGKAPRPGSVEAQVAEWYKTLNLRVGADLGEVKTAYRQLMRRYHPDMHAGNPQKQKAATELSTRVTAAYNGLQSHLTEPKR